MKNFLLYVPLIKTSAYTMIYFVIISKNTNFHLSIRVICQPNCLKAHIETRNSSVALHDFALDQKIVIAQLQLLKFPQKFLRRKV